MGLFHALVRTTDTCVLGNKAANIIEGRPHLFKDNLSKEKEGGSDKMKEKERSVITLCITIKRQRHLTGRFVCSVSVHIIFKLNPFYLTFFNVLMTLHDIHLTWRHTSKCMTINVYFLISEI